MTEHSSTLMPTPIAAPVGQEGAAALAPPWRLFQPTGAVLLTATQSRAVRRLPPGTPVMVADHRLLSRWRQARWRSALSIEREVVVLPTLAHPVALVDVTPEAVQQFWALATVPPGITWAAVPASLVLMLARRLPWSWTAALAPGRVVVGVRR